VLAQLDDIDGVEGSFVNDDGTVIRLSLRPGADREKVAGAARRVLSQEVGDRVPVRLGGTAGAPAPRGQRWWDRGRLAADAAAEAPAAAAGPWAGWLAALLLACVAALAFLWWRHRGRAAGRNLGIG